MDGIQRRAAMARFIEENDGADVQTLAERFGVSAITVRRDRKILAEQNILSPTHGGAVPAGFMYGELAYAQKVDVNVPLKKLIAKRAAELVPDNSIVILDAGTTTLELARLLMSRKLSVVTPDLQIALLLAQSPSVKVFIPGGEVDLETRSLLDSKAAHVLRETNAAISFVGIATWDASKGVSSSSIAKQEIKRTIMQQASETYLLVDSTKYGTCNPWSVAPLSDFDGIITDDGLSAKARKDIAGAEGNLLIVN
ncbi:DeoR/GlpR family DNA-binding transcription regulator [Microvirga sp. W0021]|uniref:DeoR/GlpR family DNA-binding transcription regulator n=1 Tax=Hohaiivirga grylli TaxID=3133970 RepID=A0ABV0BLQ7_9HYPH